MAKLFRILSLDGGGIRGIIPGMVLEKMERDTGTPIWKLFDLIAGTSTGGILAIALTIPANLNGSPENCCAKYSAKDVVEMFASNAKKIFPYPPLPLRHTDCDFFFRARYSASGIESVLENYTGEARLKDSLTPILVTSYDIELAKAWFFSSEEAKKKPETHDFSVRQIARATSAAPIYFPPMQLKTTDAQQYYPLVDGGVAANNPAMCAYVEAIASFDQNPDDILVVSLGTGRLQEPLLYSSVKSGGLAQWRAKLLSVLFDGNSQTVQYQMQTLLNRREEQRYYRFQTNLNKGTNGLDNAYPENVQRLKNLGASLAHEYEDQLKRLYKQLELGSGVTG